MAHVPPKAAAALASLFLAATLWLPAAQAGHASTVSVAGPVTATYALPLVA